MAVPLHYINQIRLDNVYTPAAKEYIDKKAQFGSTMSLAKTSIQIAIAEGATAELIGTLMQFIMKYCNDTGLGVNTNQTNLEQNSMLQDSPLDNLPNVVNPEYHKAKGCPPKRYKSSVEDNSSFVVKSKEGVSKTCSYCSNRGHNIRGCAKYKANKENINPPEV